MTKLKRPDRAVKFKERSVTDETVVKCKLQNALVSQMQQSHKESILKAIKKRVLGFSRRYHVMSIAVNLYIKERFDKVCSKELPSIPISEIFEQTFIRQMMLGTVAAQKPFALVEKFYHRYPELYEQLEQGARYDGDRNIYSAGSMKYLTNLKNHLTTNLQIWMKRWIYSSYIQEKLSTVEAFKDKKLICKALLYKLNDWQTTVEMTDLLNQLPSSVQRSLAVQKTILGEKPQTRKDAFDSLLRYAVFINKFLKTHDPESKLYNLAPVGRIRCHYITIDLYVLGGITAEVGLSKTQEIVKEVWDTILNTKRLEGKNCTFTGTIDTDGCAVCVHFRRLKTTLVQCSNILENGYSPDEDTAVVGLDPGRKDMLHVVVETSQGRFKSVVLTRNQYYRESGILSQNKKTEMWQSTKEMEEALNALATVTTKGNCLKRFMKYLHVWRNVFTTLWTEYTKTKWSEGRFRLYGGKKRVFAEYFNKLENTVSEKTGKTKIVVAYGSAKFAATGKGETAVPTSMAFKECKARFQTFVTPEFRSSMIHHETHTVLQLVGSRQTGREIRGLRWCCSTTQNVRKQMISRDQNAAINIRNIFQWGSKHLPTIFCRGQHPLRKAYGRWLLR